MSIKIATLTDIHDGEPGPIAKRRCELGATLLRRAVERFNRFIKPDLLLVLGDVLNDPATPDADDRLKAIKLILDRLHCPWLIIPGNHDPAPERFYAIMPRPEPVVDIKGVRVLAFTDPEAPGYNATRTDEDLARLKSARADGFTGPLITIQHVPVMPPGEELRYSYTNINAVHQATTQAHVTLSLGGHCHQRTDLIQKDGCNHLALPALCESPHDYAVLTLNQTNGINVEHESLAMPESYNLVDLHSHTQLAYCAEDVTVERSAQMAQAMGLHALAFTEHSGHLYFDRPTFLSSQMCEKGIASAKPNHNRVSDYLNLVQRQPLPLPVLLGMEVDTDFAGRPVLQPQDRAMLSWLVGAVHFIPNSDQASDAEFVAAFRQLTQGICESSVNVLAHPFRIFRRQRRDVPQDLYPWLVKLLKRTGVAAEINYHTNEPHLPFVQMCVEAGVPLTFGSDAHALWEVGEFYPHLRLLKQAVGISGDPTPLLAQPPSGALTSQPF